MTATANELYALADNLQMVIEKDGKKLVGSKSFTVRFGDLLLADRAEIISSIIFSGEPGGAAVVCKIIGDLGLVMASEHPWVTCVVVDLTKLSAKHGEGYLEALKIKTQETLWTHLREHPATRAVFKRKGVASWLPATI